MEQMNGIHVGYIVVQRHAGSRLLTCIPNVDRVVFWVLTACCSFGRLKVYLCATIALTRLFNNQSEPRMTRTKDESRTALEPDNMLLWQGKLLLGSVNPTDRNSFFLMWAPQFFLMWPPKSAIHKSLGLYISHVCRLPPPPTHTHCAEAYTWTC